MKNQIKENDFCLDLYNAVNGIQRIDEDLESKKMLLTFWDRTDFLNMSHFLKLLQAIMLDSFDKGDPSIETVIKN
jgi:hypothetical protein